MSRTYTLTIPETAYIRVFNPAHPDRTPPPRHHNGRCPMVRAYPDNYAQVRRRFIDPAVPACGRCGGA
jgi:hypothetical protein